MIIPLILAVDLVLQVIAACLAVRLILVTGKITAWTFIALAIVIMAFHRGLKGYEWITAGTPLEPAHRIICLITSILLVLGVALISPWFRRVKDSEDKLRQSEEKYRTIVETAHEGIGVLDAQDRITYVNQRMSEILGYNSSEFLGRHVLDFFDNDEKVRMQENLARRKLGTKEVWEFRIPRKDGTCVWATAAQSPILSPTGQYLGAIGMVNDVTERRRAEESLRVRASQQAAVAALGQSALAGGADLQVLFNEAVERISQNLKVEYCKLMELQPGGKRLLLRAGVGWRPGLVGTAAVDAGPGSQAGYTLTVAQPVIVEDLGTETRFSVPPLLREHEVVSGLSVIIAGPEQPFGVLGAHTARQRTFPQDDVNFLQAMANILAGAVVRQKSDTILRESAQKLHYLTSQLLVDQETERKRISLELHEDLGQTLQALALQTSSIKQRLPENQQGLYQECEDLLHHLRGIINRLRVLSGELSPHGLEDLGLGASLHLLIDKFCEHYQVHGCETNIDEIDDLFPASAQISIFRFFQEALHNIGKHAQATQISLTIKKHPDKVSFVLADNGRGFDVNEVMSQPERAAGLGLLAMEERVQILGGSLSINSRPDRGTELRFTVPLPSLKSSQEPVASKTSQSEV